MLFKTLLFENRIKSASKGCMMAMVDKNWANKISELNHELIREADLYTEDNEFGRETECHVTIKYGLSPDLNELQIRKLLKDTDPFEINVVGLSKFDNVKTEVTDARARK